MIIDEQKRNNNIFFVRFNSHSNAIKLRVVKLALSILEILSIVILNDTNIFASIINPNILKLK